MSVRNVCAVAFAVCLAAASASAHHSFAAEFDENKPVKLTGKVIEMKWSNPHSWIFIEVAGPNGKPVKWALEFGAANALFRRGWRKDVLPAGTCPSVDGWQARNGPNTANPGGETMAEGRLLFAVSQNPNPQEK